MQNNGLQKKIYFKILKDFFLGGLMEYYAYLISGVYTDHIYFHFTIYNTYIPTYTYVSYVCL